MFKISQRLSMGIVASALALGLVAVIAQRPVPGVAAQAEPAGGPTFRNFNGVNNPVSAEAAQQLGLGWLRMSFYWSDVEPKKGEWDWKKTDEHVRFANAMQAQILPGLLYSAPWAARDPAKWKGPPANVADWEDYVEHVVSRYSAPPYNLHYFQIWNEPTSDAGSWLGTDQEFIDTVYLPAARIIRNHHCLVVFGGWPMGDSLQRFNALLNYHDAWRWTDIVDTHYKGLGDFEQFYNAWVANGKCRGMWQTEVGYVPESGFLSNLYSRTLYWTLTVGWHDPDEFKLFWYANAGAPGEGEKDLLRVLPSGTVPSRHGLHLQALNQVLGQGPLAIFKDYTSVPASNGSPAGSWVLGYRVGSNRIALHLLIDRHLAESRPSVQLSISAPGRPSKVQLITGVGKSSDLPFNNAGGKIQVTVPLHTGFDDCPACASVQGFIVIDQ